MHFFAVLMFFSFGTMAFTMLGERLYRRVHGVRAFVAGGLGIALAWLANLNMWVGWSISHLRYSWVGVTLTGLAVGGAALLLYSIFGMFLGLHRKLDDEAKEIERTHLRKVA